MTSERKMSYQAFPSFSKIDLLEDKLKFIEKCDQVHSIVLDFILKLNQFRKEYHSENFNYNFSEECHKYLYVLISALENSLHEQSTQLFDNYQAVRDYVLLLSANKQSQLIKKPNNNCEKESDVTTDGECDNSKSSEISISFSQETVILEDTSLIPTERVELYNKSQDLLQEPVEDINSSPVCDAKDPEHDSNSDFNDPIFQKCLKTLQQLNQHDFFEDLSPENESLKSINRFKRKPKVLSETEYETDVEKEIPKVSQNETKSCYVRLEKINIDHFSENNAEKSTDHKDSLKRKIESEDDDKRSKKTKLDSDEDCSSNWDSSGISDCEDQVDAPEIIKDRLNFSSSSDNETDDFDGFQENFDVDNVGDTSDTNKKKRKTKFKKEKADSDSSFKLKSEDDSDGSSSDIFLKEIKRKPSWRNDFILKTNINFNDTEDESNDEDTKKRTFRLRKKRNASDLKRNNTSKSAGDTTDIDDVRIYITSDSDSCIELVSEFSNNHRPLKFENTPPKSGRRNIRAILSQDTLDVTTRKANLVEKQRKERLQKRVANLERFSNTSDSEKFVLDYDTKTNAPTIVVHPELVSRLKEHQKEGIKFMWNICYESVEKLKEEEGSGCILAHCMGLGKSFQVITLIHTLFSHPITNTKHVLIVAPFSIVTNWVKEFKKFLNSFEDDVKIHLYSLSETDYEDRIKLILKWYEKNGVLIMGYEAFHQFVLKNVDEVSTSKRVRAALLSPGPDLVILDEGHLLKNQQLQRAKSLMQILTKRRIILTGTPLQNNLSEYYAMVNFVKPNLLGSKKEFKNRFENPIRNGQYFDSNENDIKQMKKRIHILHKMLDGTTINRCGVEVLQNMLPKKFDYAIFIKLHPVQITLYKKYMELITNSDGNKTIEIFRDYQILQLICLHPRLLYCTKNNPHHTKKLQKHNDLQEMKPSFLNSNWWQSLCPDDYLNNIEYGSKYQVLMSIIKECELAGDKLLIFSGSLIDLDCIEYFLKSQSTSNSRWIHGKDYVRMDGGVKVVQRASICQEFNDESNTRLRLFLISPNVGGLGLNLTAANRVIIMNVHWNPTKDNQSIFRQYRIGQTKPSYVYRLVTMGAMEQFIYKRQITKSALACRVVDKNHITRHYNSRDIMQLYEYNFDYSSNSMHQLPVDKILAKILQNRTEIVKYHEHQLLLENRPDEQLNTEELTSAWEEFKRESEEQEKNKQHLRDKLAASNLNTSSVVEYNPYSSTLTDYDLDIFNNMVSKVLSKETSGNFVPTNTHKNFERNLSNTEEKIINLNKLQTAVANTSTAKNLQTASTVRFSNQNVTTKVPVNNNAISTAVTQKTIHNTGVFPNSSTPIPTVSSLNLSNLVFKPNLNNNTSFRLNRINVNNPLINAPSSILSKNNTNQSIRSNHALTISNNNNNHSPKNINNSRKHSNAISTIKSTQTDRSKTIPLPYKTPQKQSLNENEQMRNTIIINDAPEPQNSRILSLNKRNDKDIVEIEDDTNDAHTLLTSLNKNSAITVSNLKK